MSDQFTSIYNIQLTEAPYSAAFIRTPEQDLPTICKLPPPVLPPTIPPIVIDPPSPECKYTLPTDLIPPPYACIPEFTTELTIIPCPTQPVASQILIITKTPIAIVPDEETECGLKLAGELELCLPCIPTITAEVLIVECPTPGNPLTVLTKKPIAIVADIASENPCALKLEGEIELCVPCIPTIEGVVSIIECTSPNNQLSVITKKPIAIVPDSSLESPCGVKLEGEIELCLDVCIPTIEGVVSIIECTSPNNQLSVITKKPIAIVPDSSPESPCGVKLEGEIELCLDVCIPTISGGISVSSYGPTVSINTITPIGIVSDPSPGSGCDLVLQGSIEVAVDCANFNGTSSIEFTSGGEYIGGGLITLMSNADCGATLTGDIIVDIPPPSSITLNPTATGATSKDGCSLEYTDTLPKLTLSSEGVLDLEGVIPIPCFKCEKTEVGSNTEYVFSDIELGIVSVKEINFMNSCCYNAESMWNECGKTLTVGSPGHAYKIVLDTTSISTITVGDHQGGDLTTISEQTITVVSGEGDSAYLTSNTFRLEYTTGANAGSSTTILPASIALNHDGESTSLVPGTIWLNNYNNGASTQMYSGGINVNDGANFVDISPPSGEDVWFQQIENCEGKKAWVLMSAWK